MNVSIHCIFDRDMVYSNRGALLVSAHVTRNINPMTICVETWRRGIRYSLEKELTKIFSLNP